MWHLPLQLHSGCLFINSQMSIFITFCYKASAINFKGENLPTMSVDEKISETNRWKMFFSIMEKNSAKSKNVFFA